MAAIRLSGLGFSLMFDLELVLGARVLPRTDEEKA